MSYLVLLTLLAGQPQQDTLASPVQDTLVVQADPYTVNYWLAVKENVNLYVFVGQPIGVVMPGHLAIRDDAFPGAAHPSVVIGRPDGKGRLDRTDRPGLWEETPTQPQMVTPPDGATRPFGGITGAMIAQTPVATGTKSLFAAPALSRAPIRMFATNAGRSGGIGRGCSSGG